MKLPPPNLAKIAFVFFFLGFFTSNWDTLLTVDIAGFTFKIHQFLFLLSLGFAAASRCSGWPAVLRQLRKNGFFLCIAALGAYYGLSAFRSYFPVKSVLYAGWLLFNLATIWLTAQLLVPYFSRAKFMTAVLASLAFTAAVIIIDHIAYQFGYTAGLLGGNQDIILHWGVSRPHAFSSEPSYSATFLSFCLIAVAAIFFRAPARRHPWYFLSLLLGAFAVVAITSRSGWLGLGFGLALLPGLDLLYRRKIPYRQLSYLALAAIAASAIFYFSTPAEQRAQINHSLISSIRSGGDGSGNARMRAFGHAFNMARETSWLGTGLGASYKYFTATRDTRGEAPAGPFDSTAYGYEVIMSVWGQLLAEGGIPAVLLYLFAGFFLLRGLWRAYKAKGDFYSMGALASAMVYFVFTAFFLGNVARGDVWVWFAIWSRMALPDAGQTPEENPQRA